MPILSKQNNIIINNDEFIDEYGSPRPRTNQWGKKGDLHITTSTKIHILCDESGNVGELNYASLKKQFADGIINFTQLVYHGSGTISKKAILKKYGRYFNNREKAKETNLKRQGIEGIPRSESCKEKISQQIIEYNLTEAGIKNRLKTSERLKELLKNKTNHPMYGKCHSEESNEKNRKSNMETTRRKMLNGEINWNVGYKSGHYYSKKNDKTFYYRSSYELEVFKFLDKNDCIVSYESESLYIPYIFEGIEKIYIPDLKIFYSDGIVSLIEIKPNRLRKDKKNQAKWAYAKEYCKENNLKWEVWDESYIFSKDIIRSFAEKENTSDNLRKLENLICEDGSLSIEFRDLFFDEVNKIAKEIIL